MRRRDCCRAVAVVLGFVVTATLSGCGSSAATYQKVDQVVAQLKLQELSKERVLFKEHYGTGKLGSDAPHYVLVIGHSTARDSDQLVKRLKAAHFTRADDTRWFRGREATNASVSVQQFAAGTKLNDSTGYVYKLSSRAIRVTVVAGP